MSMITLKEYCERNGLVHASQRKRAIRGGFETARKIGRDWFVDEDEQLVDHRIKTGACIGARHKRDQGDQ